MPDIFELVNAKAIGEYVDTLQGSEEPLLGATLFPAKKIVGLDIRFIKGYKSNAVALRPSALGARALVRDRIGGAVIQHELPFFREKMVVNERLRQELARAKADVTDPYTASVIEQIFDDAKALVDGADVQAERQRLQLLFTGAIEISAPDKDGKQPNYAYNYDENSNWKTNNVVELTGTDKWSDHENSNPLQDIVDIVDKAGALGVKITRAICSPATMNDIVQNEKIRAMFKNADGSQRIFGRSHVITEIANITGVTIAVYNKSFTDENGVNKFYAPDNAMVFLPDGAVGNTVYGTTPEEIDLMGGIAGSNIKTSIVNTGVAVTTVKSYGPPVTVETVVSELVIPSFERMAEVFVVNY